VVAAAVSFAAGSTTAVVAYDAGATPLSVITARTTFTLLVVFVLIRMTGGAFRLPPRERAIALAMGLVLGVQSYCHYQAIGLLPVAIAILVLYLFPLLVGLISHVTGGERMSPALGVALVVALAGLILALDVTGEGLDPTGILLAGVAATTFSVVVVVNAGLIRRSGRSLPVTLHMNLAAATAFIVFGAVLGEFPLPASRQGWIAFAAVPMFYSIGLICFFVAIGVIGAVRASLIMNLEPIAAIVFGFTLLGQVLTPQQLLGAALVVGAIVGARWRAARASPAA
jgi:drug/metabolite transporter (DMT)-like permease